MTVLKKQKQTVTKSKLVHSIKKWCGKQKGKYMVLKGKKEMININQLITHDNDTYKNKTDEYLKQNTTVEELMYCAQYYITKNSEEDVVRCYKIASDKGYKIATKKLGMFYESKQNYDNMVIILPKNY